MSDQGSIYIKVDSFDGIHLLENKRSSQVNTLEHIPSGMDQQIELCCRRQVYTLHLQRITQRDTLQRKGK